ncbi:MAG TPA: glycosyltransferase family 4 protein [Thermoanaerobaculia bacterium]|nr:glycosyltransferase family 4 protein [Thermoanaerobaculia bacterium]
MSATAMGGPGRKIRLLFISSINVRWMHLEWLSQELDRERFDVSFLLVSIAERRPSLESFLPGQGIPFRTLECKLRPREILRTVREIRRHCRRHRIDIVHTHIFFASLVGLLGAFLAGVPVRINTRHHASMNHGTSFYWLDRLTNLLANRIIATSELLRRVLTRENAAPEKVRLVRLGIDTARFRQVPESEVRQLAARYNPRGAWPVIGVIARHIELKGVQYVVPAFQKLLETYPCAYLILGYATGPYHSTIEEKLAAIPRDRYCQIEFEENVFALYRLFDVFVHAPIGEEEESFGLTYLEALASGVPSVFTLAGVAPEFLEHRRNAWIVPHRDSDKIHEGLLALLGDPALRDALVRQGREDVEAPFGYRRMVRELEDVYAEGFRELAGGQA